MVFGTKPPIKIKKKRLAGKEQEEDCGHRTT